MHYFVNRMFSLVAAGLGRAVGLSGVHAKFVSPEHDNKFPAGLEGVLWPVETLGYTFGIK